MKKKGTIILDFLMFVIIAIVITVAVITYLNIKEMNNSYRREIGSIVKYTMLIISPTAQKSIEDGKTEKLEEIAETIMDGEDNKVLRIAVSRFGYDSETRVIFSTDKNEIGKKINREEFKGNKDKEVAIESQGYSEEKIPVYKYSRVIPGMGIIDLDLSLTGITNDFKKAFIMNIITGLIAVIIALIFTTYVLMKKIYNPIQELREEIKKIKDGEVAYQVNLNTNNELSDLASEINSMKDYIWEKSFSDKFSHPVTGLPGLINQIERISDKIEKDDYFAVLNISVENFEKYVIRSGFVKGEDYLRTLFNMIMDTLNKNKIQGYECFQTRENTISIILPVESAEAVGKEIVTKFNEEIVNIYELVKVPSADSDSDEETIIKNIEGKEIVYPKTRLIVGVIKNSTRGEIVSYKDMEDKIIEIETLYAGIKGKSVCVTAGDLNYSTANETESESSSKSDKGSDDLLEGLDEIK